MRGKFIVIYGINNLGKTTQARLLVERLLAEGHSAEYLKYGIYSLEPFGPLIDGYLRKGNPYTLSPRELQLLYVLNRTQYEPTLKEKLKSGMTIVAEDYIGTGIAWGVGAGVDETFLKQINNHLLKENIAFHFIGQRFLDSVEKGHAHEENHQLTERVREAHTKLAKEFGWITIEANQNREEIMEEIWRHVEKVLK